MTARNDTAAYYCTVFGMYIHRLKRPLLVLTVTALGLTACGGDTGSSRTDASSDVSGSDVVDRSASADGTSCPERRSLTFDGYIINGLPRGFSLLVPRESWKCDDWSGVSTPGKVFNGMYLIAGARTPFRLEGALDNNAEFTLRIDGRWMENLTEVLVGGDSRLVAEVWQRKIELQRFSQLSAAYGTKSEKWRGSGKCTFLPITPAPSSWGNTPVREVFDAFADVYVGRNLFTTTMLIVDKGRIGLVFTDAYQTSDARDLCDSPRPTGA